MHCICTKSCLLGCPVDLLNRDVAIAHMLPTNVSILINLSDPGKVLKRADGQKKKIQKKS
jgi:hypothetical protein